MLDIENNHFCHVLVSVLLESVKRYFDKFHTNLKLHEVNAELVNHNSVLPTFGVIALRTLNIAIFTMTCVCSVS